MQPRQHVAGGETMAEQPVAINVAREEVDAAAQSVGPRVPVSAADRVDAVAQQIVVGGDIGARVRVAEEAAERLVVGQVLQRAELKPAERDMRAVEIDGDDFGRIGGQVRERVAAARGDGQHAVCGT